MKIFKCLVIDIKHFGMQWILCGIQHSPDTGCVSVLYVCLICEVNVGPSNDKNHQRASQCYQVKESLGEYWMQVEVQLETLIHEEVREKHKKGGILARENILAV